MAALETAEELQLRGLADALVEGLFAWIYVPSLSHFAADFIITNLYMKQRERCEEVNKSTNQ